MTCNDQARYRIKYTCGKKDEDEEEIFERDMDLEKSGHGGRQGHFGLMVEDCPRPTREPRYLKRESVAAPSIRVRPVHQGQTEGKVIVDFWIYGNGPLDESAVSIVKLGRDKIEEESRFVFKLATEETDGGRYSVIMKGRAAMDNLA